MKLMDIKHISCATGTEYRKVKKVKYIISIFLIKSQRHNKVNR